MSLYPDPPYDYSAVAHGLVFSAGACPLDEEGRTVAPGDYAAQAERAADNLLEALAERGVDAGSLLKTTIYVVAEERGDLVRVWDTVSSRLGRAPSTLLGVSFSAIPISWSRSKRLLRSSRSPAHPPTSAAPKRRTRRSTPRTSLP